MCTTYCRNICIPGPQSRRQARLRCGFATIDYFCYLLYFAGVGFFFSFLGFGDFAESVRARLAAGLGESGVGGGIALHKSSTLKGSSASTTHQQTSTHRIGARVALAGRPAVFLCWRKFRRGGRGWSGYTHNSKRSATLTYVNNIDIYNTPTTSSIHHHHHHHHIPGLDLFACLVDCSVFLHHCLFSLLCACHARYLNTRWGGVRDLELYLTFLTMDVVVNYAVRANLLDEWTWMM